MELTDDPHKSLTVKGIKISLFCISVLRCLVKIFDLLSVVAHFVEVSIPSSLDKEDKEERAETVVKSEVDSVSNVTPVAEVSAASVDPDAPEVSVSGDEVDLPSSSTSSSTSISPILRATGVDEPTELLVTASEAELLLSVLPLLLLILLLPSLLLVLLLLLELSSTSAVDDELGDVVSDSEEELTEEDSEVGGLVSSGTVLDSVSSKGVDVSALEEAWSD